MLECLQWVALASSLMHELNEVWKQQFKTHNKDLDVLIMYGFSFIIWFRDMVPIHTGMVKITGFQREMSSSPKFYQKSSLKLFHDSSRCRLQCHCFSLVSE